MKKVKINNKSIEIFCGTGGVGKTTLATSRALYLAYKKYKILLITIDPAKRLKEILDLNDEDAGKVKKISSQIFKHYRKNKINFSFDALLMSPAATLKRLGKLNETQNELANPILKILTKPYGGTNEIMSIIEVQYHLSTNKYDAIILDTPPGKHFIDFLQSSQKIQDFFDKSFIDIFMHLGKSIGDHRLTQEAKGILSAFMSSGIKKLLHYLEKVTGASFIDEFINAIIAIYNNKESFVEALNFQENLKDQDFSNWFLVTSIEQQNLSEAFELQNEALEFMHQDNFLAINKSVTTYLNDWRIEKNSSFTRLKESMVSKESKAQNFAKRRFKKIIEFNEIFKSSPGEHVYHLAQHWKKWDK